MERKASFSIEAPKRRSSQHNSRVDIPKYLIEQNENFDGNFYAKYNGYESDTQMSELLQNFYKKKIGQRMQKKQVPALIKEAVITLKKEHTEKDVLSLFDTLKKKYGGHEVLEIAIHHDEGHFQDENGMTYAPNEDIFYNKVDKNWYLDPKLKKLAPENLTKIFNYHAHVKFTMLNLETARTPQMPKKKYSERHKVVAGFLGLRHAPGKTRYISKTITQIKAEHNANREKQKEEAKEKAELKAKIAELQAKLQEKGKVTQKDLRQLKEEYRKEMIASKLLYEAKDYQALNQLFKEAIEDNKKKSLDIDMLALQVAQLSERRESYQAKNERLEGELGKAEEKINDLEEQLRAIEIINAKQQTTITEKDSQVEKLINQLKKVETLLKNQSALIEKLSQEREGKKEQVASPFTKEEVKKLIDAIRKADDEEHRRTLTVKHLVAEGIDPNKRSKGVLSKEEYEGICKVYDAEAHIWKAQKEANKKALSTNKAKNIDIER